jgi:acyl CoA:acetate/3-ketoacid CoA transferase
MKTEVVAGAGPSISDAIINFVNKEKIDLIVLGNVGLSGTNFEGGIIDAASLGFLQVDKKGNVNPPMLLNRIFGPGGFPVIAGRVSRIYFAGSFMGGKSYIGISDNKIRILHEGTIPKFVESVFKIVFSGHQAIKYGQEIMYITERAVFRLNGGLVLEEIAPGIT